MRRYDRLTLKLLKALWLGCVLSLIFLPGACFRLEATAQAVQHSVDESLERAKISLSSVPIVFAGIAGGGRYEC